VLHARKQSLREYTVGAAISILAPLKSALHWMEYVHVLGPSEMDCFGCSLVQLKSRTPPVCSWTSPETVLVGNWVIVAVTVVVRLASVPLVTELLQRVMR
jgi:hypothetical protein